MRSGFGFKKRKGPKIPNAASYLLSSNACDGKRHPWKKSHWDWRLPPRGTKDLRRLSRPPRWTKEHQQMCHSPQSRSVAAIVKCHYGRKERTHWLPCWSSLVWDSCSANRPSPSSSSAGSPARISAARSMTPPPFWRRWITPGISSFISPPDPSSAPPVGGFCLRRRVDVESLVLYSRLPL